MTNGRLEQKAFHRFLAARCGMAPADASEPGEWSDLGNLLGAIALRLGLLTVDQIDQILGIQEEGGTWQRFGEIAVERGFLTPDQLDRLCQIQRIHRLLETGEQMLVRGQLDVDCLVQSLSEFWELHASGLTCVGSRFGSAQDA